MLFDELNPNAKVSFDLVFPGVFHFSALSW
jgi:hypothetical protein